MIDNKKWIQQSDERKKLARKLIDMGAKDFEEFDELKDVSVEILQTWIIEALEEQNTNLQEMLKAERSVTCKEEYLKTVAELEAQIEKMKCCYNCRHSRTEYEHCKTNKHEKWEIKENDKEKVM